ncbi:CNNM domain-containing protein [Aliiglaciecola sp. LCG003]|uniref:CNNM domain-containing protein n=1 Tax=Aliiglaciecola sp. LCG003 TaxID=3053655 RepID=UPI002573F690|nr:CNNM domain-containing protein [Aliiglaciecola sp. LCG003]WJG07792.1 CNNM domain-containing protein [Aliiglaciecola sp. LCG003]
MLLLFIYVFIALGFSFLCSVAEAVILSISSAHISVSMKKGEKSGQILHDLTADINKPLSAILTLNTIAHTMGAAGAGAQAAVVFGDAYLGVASAILTFLILVFSEIIPKTLGATFWRQLAPATAYFLKYLVIVLYPFVKMSNKLTSGFTEDSPLKGLSRGELHAMAELSQQEGQLDHQQANILQSLLSLDDLRVKDAMTHRTVVFKVSENMTVEAFYHKYASEVFSRIPIYEDNESEKISGFVMKSDLLLAQARGNGDKPLSAYRKDMIALLASTPLSETISHFITTRAHMLLVIDEYGGMEGILTMEDLLESLLGFEIVDEKDKNISMKKVAKLMWKRRERMLFNQQKDN